MPTESRPTEALKLQVRLTLNGALSGQIAPKLSIEITHAGTTRMMPLRNATQIARGKWPPAFAAFCLRSAHSVDGRTWWESGRSEAEEEKKKTEDRCYDRFHYLAGVGPRPSLKGKDKSAAEPAWTALWSAIDARSPQVLRWHQTPSFSFFREEERLDDAGQARLLAELEHAYDPKTIVRSALSPEFQGLLDEARAAIALGESGSTPPTEVDQAPPKRAPVPHRGALLSLGAALLFAGVAGGYFLGTRDVSALAGSAGSARCGNANLTQWRRDDAEQYKRLFGDVQRDFRAYNAAFQVEDSSDRDDQQLERYGREPPIKHQYLFTDCRFYCSSRAYWLKLSEKSRKKSGVSKLSKDNPQVKLLLRPTDGVTAPHYFLGTGAGKTPLMYVYPFVDPSGYPEFVLELYDDRQEFRMSAALDKEFRKSWQAAGESIDWTTQGICHGDPCESLVPKTAR